MCESINQQPATTTSTNNALRHWLALSRAPHPHIHLYQTAIVLDNDITALFTADPALLRQAGLSPKQIAYLRQPPWTEIDRALTCITQHHWHVVTYPSRHYPALLKQMADPPMVLFVDGDPTVLSRQQIAMVGSRNPSADGLELACYFAHNLADHEIVITSGLALGIDAASHQGALNSNIHPYTIAVIATGLDRCYPARHQTLAQQIRDKGGAIVSEFLPGTAPHRHHFPQRNRIISGLSQGVLVVEAGLRSGSLITARFAMEQNRDVFAIPGAIHNPMAKGCHYLLRDGAQLVENVDDILQTLFPTIMPSAKDKKLDTQASTPLDNDHAFLLKCVGYQVTPIEQIIIRSKLPAAIVATRLTDLTLLGHIKACTNGYARVR